MELWRQKLRLRSLTVLLKSLQGLSDYPMHTANQSIDMFVYFALSVKSYHFVVSLDTTCYISIDTGHYSTPSVSAGNMGHLWLQEASLCVCN